MGTRPSVVVVEERARNSPTPLCSRNATDPAIEPADPSALALPAPAAGPTLALPTPAVDSHQVGADRPAPSRRRPSPLPLRL